VRKLRCSSLIDNGGTPHLVGQPEIDDFRLVSWSEAKELVFRSQRVIFETTDEPK
jgi:hypothetical protein